MHRSLLRLLCTAHGRYGWFVLRVEMLGATSTIMYGLNIIFTPCMSR